MTDVATLQLELERALRAGELALAEHLAAALEQLTNPPRGGRKRVRVDVSGKSARSARVLDPELHDGCRCFGNRPRNRSD